MKATDNTLVRRRSLIREMLVKGDVEKAGQKAEEWGINIEDCKLIAQMEAPPEVVLPPGVPAAKPPVPKREEWPKHTDLFVYAYPINKRMVIVRLPDKREAYLWRSSNQQYPIGARIRGILLETVGPQAYYEVQPD